MRSVLPVVEDTVYHQPFHLDSIAVKLLLHVDKERILVLPLCTFIIITLPSKINRRWFVHVSLSLVVTEHHLAIQLQLWEGSREEQQKITGFVCMSQKYNERSTFSNRSEYSFKECMVPVVPAPRSSASRTYCTT